MAANVEDCKTKYINWIKARLAIYNCIAYYDDAIEDEEIGSCKGRNILTGLYEAMGAIDKLAEEDSVCLIGNN